MTAERELRDKLTKALANASAYRNPGDVADALMPVVREALAEAWSTGFREGRNADHQSCWWPKNPWRGEQP